MESWRTSFKLFAVLLFVGLIFSFSTNSLQAQQAELYKDGPVHEAFLTPSTEGGVVLQSIAAAPPPTINEQQPPKCHSEAIWIPGYWSWIQNMNDFVWVSGVWRRPPPGHVWIPGYWKKFDAGWAWVRGFWNDVAEHELQYINEPPPNPREEQIPPKLGDNYFWMPGYWNYDHARASYNWLGGQWVELDANWVYVPAYYLWRPGGYLFIPGYWDLPIELRGCAYAAVSIPPAVRSTIIYTPAVILQADVIIRWAFLFYPDFSIFFWHHWHFHPGFWGGWCCIPPWWHWNTCWCFSWHDSWGLWWWWSHPGFPNPWWLLFSMANHIPPPPWLLLNMMQNIMGPPIILPFGVVSPFDLINAIGGNLPIMPNDPKDLEDIYGKLRPEFSQDQTPLKPTGNESDLDKPLPRPNTGEQPESGGAIVTPPPTPPSALPPITRPPASYIPKPPSLITPPVLPPIPPQYLPPVPRPPTYQPPSYKPPSFQTPRPYPQPRPYPNGRPQPYPSPWGAPHDDYPHRIPWNGHGEHKPPSTNHVDGHGPESKPPVQTYPPNQSHPGGESYTPQNPSHGNWKGPSHSYPPNQSQSGGEPYTPKNPSYGNWQGNPNSSNRIPQIQGNWRQQQMNQQHQRKLNPNNMRQMQRGSMQSQPRQSGQSKSQMY